MSTVSVKFNYLTGLKINIFKNARLVGSWDKDGFYSDNWSSVPMQQVMGDDGCPSFRAKIKFDSSQIGYNFQWGVVLDTPNEHDLWGIATEVNDHNSKERYRTFRLDKNNGGIQKEQYYLTHCKRLGANKYYRASSSTKPSIKFSVWAPNAKKVALVFGNIKHGYIADDGTGIDNSIPPISMFYTKDGIWRTDENKYPILKNFSRFDHKPYMFKITQKTGKVVYRTDLYSRCQIGGGKYDPQGAAYTGDIKELDGTKSCSVVVDPDSVTKHFTEPVWPETTFVSEKQFWKNEFPSGISLPKRIEDLVIYELHIGAIWNGSDRPGSLEDAMELIDYLKDLGINAVELLPINEFEGWAKWGYGSSHYFAIEYSAGGRDQFKHFVRKCHQNGIAVILDVVYNHYHHNAERAEWAYDSDVPEENIYYWYEGRSSDYPNANPPGHGGYVDNMSTGYAPRYYDEMVRKMFISSAAMLVEEFHVDGFRVDQTTSIHSYNVLHADGRKASQANIFGAKFLRELTGSLKLVNPEIMLVAEDHSKWDMITKPLSAGGLNFDAAWYANFYHQLIGDTGRGTDFANLLRTAGYGGDIPLAMDSFQEVLSESSQKKVVYHESHDEAGNSAHSLRTIRAAVNSAPLIGQTRNYAEARSRFCFGMSMLSAGTPMFLMGEEVGAEKDYTYDTFMQNRENIKQERRQEGKYLFKFYQDLIKFRYNHPAVKAHDIDIIHTHNANRVIAFLRREQKEELLVVASLNNHPFNSGYFIENPDLGSGLWKEVFNSDAGTYNGNNIGNLGSSIPSNNGRINVVIPACGFVVFSKVAAG